jgi:hypothetical protein
MQYATTIIKRCRSFFGRKRKSARGREHSGEMRVERCSWDGKGLVGIGWFPRYPDEGRWVLRSVSDTVEWTALLAIPEDAGLCGSARSPELLFNIKGFRLFTYHRVRAHFPPWAEKPFRLGGAGEPGGPSPGVRSALWERFHGPCCRCTLGALGICFSASSCRLENDASLSAPSPGLSSYESGGGVRMLWIEEGAETFLDVLRQENLAMWPWTSGSFWTEAPLVSHRLHGERSFVSTA